MNPRGGSHIRVKLLYLGVLLSITMVASFALATEYAANARANGTMPFAPGERLHFRLRWTVVPAGEATMEVLPIQTIDGQKVYHFRLTAESNSFVDLFYKVRDRIDAFASIDMTHTVKYLHKQHEGDNRKNVEVNFNWDNKSARYFDGRSSREIEIQTGTFDPLSVFYFSRMAEFEPHGLIEAPVTDGRKCVIGQARVIKRETIHIVSGSYDTYLLEPDLKHVGGVFEKSKDAKIQLWVTADKVHMPVKIASKVAVGSFVAELTAVEHAEQPSKNIACVHPETAD